MAMTDYFQVLTPERWKYLCRYETTETENGGYKLTYYNEDVPVLTLEARYYDGEDQPLDSVWQGYLGRIETVDAKNTIFCPPSASTPRTPLMNGRKCMTLIWMS